MKNRICLLLLAALVASPVLAAPARQDVYIEDMTWMEIRDRLNAGATTIIIPTGGTEQNGPHLATGKHNFVMEYTGGTIARALGNAMVAPVLPYVPEGRINPPEGHMRFPGTISISETAFAGVLEDAARSFKQHGFRLICLVGDHGGSIDVQQQVADKLNSEWRGQSVRVVNVRDYYKDNGQVEWARARKVKSPQPQAHGGYFDTSEMLALRPENVRRELIAEYGEDHYLTGGVAGDPREATAEAGEKLLSLKVDAAVKQIRNAENRR